MNLLSILFLLIFVQVQTYVKVHSCFYLCTVALSGPLEGLPYTPASSGETEGVVTNLTCPYDYYSCTVDGMNETSCDNFGGNAVVTCLIQCT